MSVLARVFEQARRMRPRAAASEAIDLVRWQWQHLCSLLLGRPWPPRVHPDGWPVWKRRRSWLAAVHSARVWSAGALCVALLLVGAILVTSDSRPTASGPPATVARSDGQVPQTAPATGERDTRAHTTSAGRRASRGPRPRWRAHTKARSQGRSREAARAASRRAPARRQAGRHSLNQQASQQPGGRRPPVRNPTSGTPNPPPQQSPPAVVASPAQPTAPTPSPPPPPPGNAPADSRPNGHGGGGHPSHPHEGPPGQGGNRGSGR
jgi:hypothetical protein